MTPDRRRQLDDLSRHLAAAEKALGDKVQAITYADPAESEPRPPVQTIENVWVEDEALIDAVTAVSGSGPAYVFLLAESLAEAGISIGLEPDVARRLARATVSGAGELLRRSQLPPGELRRNVTSPGGTTAAALAVLMADDGLPALMARAVAAAERRAKELAG